MEKMKKMKKINWLAIGVLCAICADCEASACRLEVGSPFADRMVLQRERSVPVWGWGTPGETVTVEFAGQRKTAKIPASGKWRVDLDPLPACNEGRNLTVSQTFQASRTSQTVLSDVLVGEVWLCAGQSNMVVPRVGEHPHGSDEQGGMTAQLTRKPNIRYVVASDGEIASEECPRSGKPLVWKKFLPENLSQVDGFSAIATYFASQLHDALDIPIGIIGVYNGGTAIEPWIPRQAYAQNEGFEGERDWRILGWDEFYKTEGMKAILPEKCWKGQNRAQHQPKAIWNRQLAPLAPFAVRGLVWYQGCSNRCWPERYCKLMHLLYDGWSAAFENPGMPIYFVQLASNEPDTPLIWEQQAQFEREEPHAAMVVANDLGNIHDVHPVCKRPIGVRLAAHALKRDYGFDIQDNSPTLKSWTLNGNKFVLAFHDVKTWYAYNPDWSIQTGFEIAGPDGVFHPARIENMDGSATNAVPYKTSGRIEGRKLIVVSDEVWEPKSLRYLHQSPWRGILFNEVNLPLAAFKIQVDK